MFFTSYYDQSIRSMMTSLLSHQLAKANLTWVAFMRGCDLRSSDESRGEIALAIHWTFTPLFPCLICVSKLRGLRAVRYLSALTLTSLARAARSGGSRGCVQWFAIAPFCHASVLDEVIRDSCNGASLSLLSNIILDSSSLSKSYLFVLVRDSRNSVNLELLFIF